MKSKVLMLWLGLCLVSAGWMGGAFAASRAGAKADAGWTRKIAEDVRVKGDERFPSAGPWAKYPAYGAKGPIVTCDDIDPEVGYGQVIQHDQIGHTWYDLQQNGSMGRMIAVTSDGYRHFSWAFTDGPHGTPPHYLYVDANCKNPAGMYMGQLHVDGGVSEDAGYSNQDCLANGISVVAYHESAGQIGLPRTCSMLAMEGSKCSGVFNRHWDIPDSILGAPSGEKGMWTKAAVKYEAMAAKDYIHVVVTEGNPASGEPVMMAYERCYLDADPDYLICQAYVNGATQTYTLNKNTNYSNPSRPVADFDISCGVTPVPVVSPVSGRVAVVYLKGACDGSCDYLSDVAYIESMNSAQEWVDGTYYPPPSYNVTDYGCGFPEDKRAYQDLSACYDYNDSLHVIWSTVGFPEPGYLQPGIARLWHWSKLTGTRVMASAVWGNTDPGANNANIAKMSISAQDPVYHPGGTPDSVYLFCTWTQFDTNTSLGGVQDNSDVGFTNGEIYATGSTDGGLTWGRRLNLTQTRTPNCTPGNCVSEHWSSLAQNMQDGDLHIQYVCDKHPGTAVSGYDENSQWVDNPVYYLHLAQWEIGEWCEGYYTMVDPASFWRPAVKVTPGGSRVITLNLANIGSLPMPYVAIPSASAAACITGAYSDVLPVGEDVDLTFTVSGAGANCQGKFIQGTIDLTWCDQTANIPVHAVAADDYYECPVDPETFDTLETDALTIYANANSLEWIHDISSFPDTVHEVFFRGGSFVATSIGGERAVGRWYGDNDWRAGVRDRLYYDYCAYDTLEPPASDHNCHLLYTKNVFIHHPPTPPYTYHCFWWWWEWSKMIKVCELPGYQIVVINYVRVQRHDPPTWWPDAEPPQGPYTGHEDTYIGTTMDIDCPWDTMGAESARNLAGYDIVNQIAWQQGFYHYGDPAGHPEYANYFAGMALADPEGDPDSIIPYASHNVKANTYLYPQAPWGWDDEQLYDLASTPGVSIQDQDSLVDRAQVLVARHIPAGNDPGAEASFVVVEAATPNGLASLQALIDTARAIVIRERLFHGFPVLCGDADGDGDVDLDDAVYIMDYRFESGPPPPCPAGRADVNHDGIIELGDAVSLLIYLFKDGPEPDCPGIAFSPPTTVSVPRDLKASSDLSGVDLSWSNAQKYEVLYLYCETDTLVLLQVFVPGTDSTYSYTPESPGTYCYYLRGEKDGELSEFSNPACASYGAHPYEVPSAGEWSGSAFYPAEYDTVHPQWYWHVEQEGVLTDKATGWQWGLPQHEPVVQEEGWGTNLSDPYYENNVCTPPLASAIIRMPEVQPPGGTRLHLQHWYRTAYDAGEPDPDDRCLVSARIYGEPGTEQFLYASVDGLGFVPYADGTGSNPCGGTVPGFNGEGQHVWSRFPIPTAFNGNWVQIRFFLGTDGSVNQGAFGQTTQWFLEEMQAVGTGLHRGDADGDGILLWNDAVYLLNYLFRNGPPPMPLPGGDSAGDALHDQVINVGDAIYLLNFHFKGGPPPPPP